MNLDRTRRRWVHVTAVGMFVIATLLAPACSSDDDGASASSRSSTTAAAKTKGSADAPSTSAAAGTPTTIAVTAVDYEYEGIPDEVAVGSELTLHNESTKEVHEMVVFRLPDGETRSGEELSKLPQSELESLLSGAPTMVLVAPPASDGFAAVGDGTIGKPGRYLAICAIPVGANPQAYMQAAQQSKGGPVSVPGGPPHFMSGMYADFTVS